MRIDEIKLALESEAYDSLRQIILELTENEQITEAHLEYLKQAMLVDDKPVFDSAHNAFLFMHKDLLQSASLQLAELIPTSSMQARNAAGELLRGYGTNSFEALIPLLKHSDFDVRKFACDVLGLIGEVVVEDDVIPLLSDEDTNVRTSAIETLGNIRSKKAIDKFSELFAENEDLQNNIIDSAGKIGGEEAEHFLLDLMDNSDDEFVKILAIEALAYCGSSMDVVKQVENVMPKFNSEVQKLILKTITAIPYRLNEPYHLPDEFRPVAIDALEEDDEDLQLSGLIALGSDLREDDLKIISDLASKDNENINQLLLINLVESNNIPLIENFIENLLNSDAKQAIINLVVTASFLFNQADIKEMNDFMEIAVEKAKIISPDLLEDLDIN